VGATRAFIADVAELASADPTLALGDTHSRMPWWSRSVDSTYLTGKRVFIFGDATHAVAAARIARDELGFEVCGLGCYNREFAREIRAAAKEYGVEPLITDDHLAVEDAIIEAAPEMVLGTQMERHIAKRLGMPCAVISAPVHVQDFPARHSPQMGFEGANVIFDTWVHPLVMGLEEHLLTMFREDFEFSDEAGASHHAAHSPKAMMAEAMTANTMTGDPAIVETPVDAPAPEPIVVSETIEDGAVWTAEATKELRKIPFFVRGKARRNTEAFAAEQGLAEIDLETLYDAKAHYAR
ncbi:MAG: nitrogenase component 1, partial [Pseudomonadota bacterium]